MGVSRHDVGPTDGFRCSSSVQNRHTLLLAMQSFIPGPGGIHTVPASPEGQWPPVLPCGKRFSLTPPPPLNWYCNWWRESNAKYWSLWVDSCTPWSPVSHRACLWLMCPKLAMRCFGYCLSICFDFKVIHKDVGHDRRYNSGLPEPYASTHKALVSMATRPVLPYVTLLNGLLLKGITL